MFHISPAIVDFVVERYISQRILSSVNANLGKIRNTILKRGGQPRLGDYSFFDHQSSKAVSQYASTASDSTLSIFSTLIMDMQLSAALQFVERHILAVPSIVSNSSVNDFPQETIVGPVR